MEVILNIEQNLKSQFESQFKLKEIDGEYFLSSTIGQGRGMKFLNFPGQLEFYHFKKSSFAIPVQMKSINPKDSEWFLIHINLSGIKQQKTIENKVIEFQKHLPAGLLLYGPGLEIDTHLSPNVEMELASIHFNHSFMDSYFGKWKDIIDADKNLVYEDLDYELENILYKALSSIDNKIECHALVLKFKNLFLNKISAHSKVLNRAHLHTEDIKSLLMVSALLRDPLSHIIPTIEELANKAKMGKTKFKTSFKQLFGCAPIQYRNKIRMEFAREVLENKRKSPTEVSFILGYSHPSNFTLAYKKYFGHLPSSLTV